MKKVAGLSVVVVVVALLIGAGVLFWKRLAPPSIRPEALLPGETLVLVELADLPRTAIRWQSTELNKLWEEPAVQAFMEKPLATYPAFVKAGSLRQELIKLWPRQVFAAIVSMEGAEPKMIGGFSFAGDEKVAEGWLAEARQKMKGKHPAGKADLVLHGKTEIETYTDKEFVVAESTHGGWHFAANDLALLEATLDRVDAGAKSTAPSLAGDDEYKKAFAPLPREADVRIFARTAAFLDRLVAAAAAGDPAKSTGLEALRKVRALAAVSKLEGGLVHDAVFSLGNGEPTPEALARGALELTDPETAVFYSALLSVLDLSGVPAEMRSAIPYAATLETALKAQNATAADLPAIFGPEFSLILPRTKGKMSGVLAIGLRDAPRAAKLAESLTAPALGAEAWIASDEDGQHVYTAPPSGTLLSTPPVLAVTDRYWLLSNSPASFTPLANRDTATPQIDHTAAYRELAGSVIAPTQAFGYFDLGSLFESYYGPLRSLLALGLVGDEATGQYFDAGKLPDGPVLSRHLGGLVFSQATVPEGSLWEARGNLSIAQLIVGGALGYFSSGAPLPGLAKPPEAAPEPAPPAPPAPPSPEPPPPAPGQ